MTLISKFLPVIRSPVPTSLLSSLRYSIPVISQRLFSRQMTVFNYPETRRDDVVDELHGVKVPDPYRWLEDPKSEETQDFVKAQNSLFEEYIARFPYLETYREHLTKSCDYERYGLPFRCGDRWYYGYNEGLSNQSIYYTVKDVDSKEKGEIFFDPNKLSEDGTIAIDVDAWSHDGSLYAYALAESGSDWSSARIRTVETEEDYPETLKWLKFTSLTFTHDNKGFFYQRYPEPGIDAKDAGTETGVNENAMLYYHVLGTEQSEDVLIYTDAEHPNQFYGASVTFDGDWVQLYISESTAPVNKLWLAKLTKKGLGQGELEWIKIKDDFNSRLSYIANNGNTFYFKNNLNAPRGSVVRYDLNHPEDGFVTIVPEQPSAVLKAGALVNENYLVLKYGHNVQHKLLVVPLASVEKNLVTNATPNGVHSSSNGIDLSTNLGLHESLKRTKLSGGASDTWLGLPDHQEVAVPVGVTVELSVRRDEPRFFFRCNGYTLPSRIYRYKFLSDETTKAPRQQNGLVPGEKEANYGELSIWRESVINGYNPDNWAVEQVWVPNPHDGVKIPMYIVRPKSLVKSGNAFCLLYGYGGFNISLNPSFSSSTATMLEHTGGLYCVANIRGGGEFGEEWHKAAIREKRPVAFSDFEECGRYLIREGWTCKEKLVCQGGSNGGALVGAVINRTGNSIFGAAIAQVGVLDLLRYHLFTIGSAWKADYGDPDVTEDFEFIYKWSPYHNVRDGKDFQYPAVLCVTSDHDDRVVPLHSFKFVAALKYAAGKTNQAPLLLRHNLKAGHGAGKPTKKRIEEWSELFAFMMVATGTKFIPTKGESQSNGSLYHTL